MKRNINKQEIIVSVLYEFARNQANEPHDTKSMDFDGKNELSVNLAAVGKALEQIMATFGYQVTEIQ